MTFDDFCDQWKVTAGERVELAHFLASLRYRETLAACLKETERRNDENTKAVGFDRRN